MTNAKGPQGAQVTRTDSVETVAGAQADAEPIVAATLQLRGGLLVVAADDGSAKVVAVWRELEPYIGQVMSR